MSKRNNWRGCENIEFVFCNTQADPDLIYKGYTFNYYDIDDALWGEFLEFTGHTDSESDNPQVENEFNNYVQANAEDYLNDCIFGGYFADDSKSWHDKYN